jgi:hypothetical protein
MSGEYVNGSHTVARPRSLYTIALPIIMLLPSYSSSIVSLAVPWGHVHYE